MSTHEFRPILKITVGCATFVALLQVRMAYTGAPTYAFLLWNLLLATLPLAFAGLVRLSVARARGVAVLFSLLWLLFLPNAPYLITDLIHIRYSDGGLVLVDAMLLLLAALCGLALGLLSLRWMQTLAEGHWGAVAGRALALLSLALSGLGMALGRTLRWNSWDLLTRPRLLLEMAGYVANPLSHWRLWGMTVLFAAVLIYVYWLVNETAAPETAT
ncbi:MAG: DUF1361 domain-containing protein [Caldilineales bacterium]